MQSQLSLLIRLSLTHRLIKSPLDLVRLLALQNRDLTQRTKSLPDVLFAEPDFPLFDVFTEGKGEERVGAAGYAEWVAGELGVEDLTPFFVAEAWGAVVVGPD